MTSVLQSTFSGTTVDDGSHITGSLTLRIAPVAHEWQITSLSVKVATNTNEAACYVYQNQIGQQYVRDHTDAGSTGDTSDTVHLLHDGDCLWIVWTGADIGVTASVTIVGTEYLPGEGGF